MTSSSPSVMRASACVSQTRTMGTWLWIVAGVVLAVVVSGRPPLIAYVGQPVDLSAEGLRSKEAVKSARYAAQEILQQRVQRGLMSPCVTVASEIVRGSSKVVAGIQYFFNLHLTYKPSWTSQCRRELNRLPPIQDEFCDVEVVFQPYQPRVAEFALMDYACYLIPNVKLQ